MCLALEDLFCRLFNLDQQKKVFSWFMSVNIKKIISFFCCRASVDRKIFGWNVPPGPSLWLPLCRVGLLGRQDGRRRTHYYTRIHDVHWSLIQGQKWKKLISVMMIDLKCRQLWFWKKSWLLSIHFNSTNIDFCIVLIWIKHHWYFIIITVTVVNSQFDLNVFVFFVLQEVIEAIKETAFKTTDFPVILSFENHCG